MGCHNWEKVSDRRWCEGWAHLHDVGKEELSVGDRNAEGKFGAL